MVIQTKNSTKACQMGKDFLMTCFARKASERWSVEMLLSHLFLMVLKPTVYGKYNLL
ncbi:hypothetical protein Gotri_021252 [Gossypium trilobum]|uniref:Uncharacterized protein n=1 Tax=Gossypium trilobum TaxID=34281 RepID=A0A7J9DBW5_9ROSI|nr:hypothetical protein [Gossypium trilobum]